MAAASARASESAMIDRSAGSGRCARSRSCRERISGRAWHEDYAQTGSHITGRCRPAAVGYRRPGIDHLRLLFGWVWRFEDGLCLRDSDHAGLAAGQL